ncbi:MAG: endonuclease MutS2 [Blautia sp.]|nr:endonuclease MutS2 [Blautia sp.]
MNEKALKSLEYTKIISLLVDKASSPAGKNLCRGLLPLTDRAQIEIMQQQTADALSRLFRKGSISFSGAKDVRGSLKRLEIGSALNAPELLAICSLLENAAKVKGYGRSDKAFEEGKTDSLSLLFDQLAPLTSLSSEIRRCVLSEDEISDDASPGLRSVRRQIKSAGDKIHSQLNSMVNGSVRTYLMDNVVTIRNGRYCLPVKAEYKNQVDGIVHDQSSTGSTLFIEPKVIIQLNNGIRELELQEKKEIDAVLASLSESVAQSIDDVRIDLDILISLDFIFARASLAMDMNASMPLFNDEKRIYLKQARHPLIEKKKAVPIDVRLGDGFDLLIITGPNTGGKTVSLKTVGLLTLMGQAGLHIPAMDRSELAIFTEVYADIGDEQSIEQSLSTFSSHMTNVVSFLKKADEDSLVLFDELGAGTDPTEGAALAIAILSHLHERGIRTMATTHYSELKLYALSTRGVENACCEFNVDTLRPTYRLLIGVPGKSNAFAISQKLGLPEHIIEKAKEQISEEDESFEDVLTSLEDNRVNVERERLELEQARREVEQLRSKLSGREEKLEEQKEKILQKANEEAQRVLREAKEYADESMKLFRKFQKDHVDTAALERERAALRERLSKAQSGSMPTAPQRKPVKELTPETAKLGESVHVISMNLDGTISSRPDAKGFLFVQMGIIRSKVHISDLELIPEPDKNDPKYGKTGAGKIRMSKSAHVPLEINLLGKTVDEAIQELDKYLDDAYLAHLENVRIVHGKGTGALRKGIHDYLKKQKRVSSYRLGEFGEGDAGVTIVNFKR